MGGLMRGNLVEVGLPRGAASGCYRLGLTTLRDAVTFPPQSYEL